ncbi:MAG TPA: alpha/beta hydrolase [Bryobacteraceae bacterium]|jgi:pimeloyl-ACP methyl ester carboxylesterase|nr:alpha/beta hydrolase [Bryobacteraceae bacterium]
MDTAISADGTHIAYWREGSGPPLLLVHGGLCDHFAWYFAVPLLARQFTVYTFDRRGRGGSEDTQPYAAEREREDIAALLHQIGEPAHLLGHSAGGILALQAATRTHDLRSLMLYEPGFIIDRTRERPAPESLATIRSLLADGNPDAAVRLAMRESVGMSDGEIAALAAGRGWSRLLSVACAIPNDWMLWQEEFEARQVADLRTPTLLLLGSESPHWLRHSTEAIRAALPNAQLAMLPGQSHSAMISAPQMFAQAVIDFAGSL